MNFTFHKIAQLLLILTITGLYTTNEAFALRDLDAEAANIKACAHDEIDSLILSQDTNTAQARAIFEDGYTQFMNLKTFGNANALIVDEILTIPVVYHIQQRASDEEITDEEIQNSLDWINEEFANIPGSQLPPGTGFYRADSTDIRIQFVLALQDPNGNPTTGITRNTVTYNTIPTDAPNAATNIVNWPAKDYVNIWIVPGIVDAAGYAYFPPSTPNTAPDHRGGIFIDMYYMDNIVMNGNVQNEYTNRNMVLVHELGHYLGLYHTFQSSGNLVGCTLQPGDEPWACRGQTNNNCLTDGDRICDTPPDGWSDPGSGTTCLGGSPMNTSPTDAYDTSSNNPFTTDVNDIHSNVMDYGGINCLQQITENQKDRMRYVAETLRSDLLISPGLTAPNTNTCQYRDPILTLTPTQLNANTVGQSGTITANIKNNNFGTCTPATISLGLTQDSEKVEITIPVDSLQLANQETQTLDINYVLVTEANLEFTLQFEATQTGQNLIDVEGILITSPSLSTEQIGNLASPFAIKDASLTTTEGTTPKNDDSKGCQSQGSNILLLLLALSGFCIIRKNIFLNIQ